MAKPKSNVSKTGENGFFKTYCVEPAMFLHMLSGVTVFVVLQGFLMEKACSVNLEYSDEVCEALTSKNRDPTLFVEEEKELQKLIGTLLMYRTMFENIFPLFLVLLIGSWSDKYGRKLPMLFVVVGFLLQNVGLILTVLWKPIGAWTIVLITSVLPGLTGNQASFNMACFSHVTDTTVPEKRTFRTTITHSVLFFSITMAIGLGGFLTTTSLGFIKIFLLGVVAETIVFSYIMLFVENIRDEKTVKGKSKKDILLDLFNTTNVRDAFSTVIKKRPGNTRTKLFMLLLSHFCVLGPMVGEMGVLFLFGRYKFNWDGGQLGAFVTYRMILTFLGNFVSMGLLSQKLKLTDPGVGVCACISGICGSLLYAFTNSAYLMFAGPVVAIFSSCNLIVPRTILSKIIPHNELGKVNSFLACLESLAPLVLAPIYTQVYTHSFEILPGAFFLVTVTLLLFPLLTYIFFLNDEQIRLKTNNKNK